MDHEVARAHTAESCHVHLPVVKSQNEKSDHPGRYLDGKRKQVELSLRIREDYREYYASQYSVIALVWVSHSPLGIVIRKKEERSQEQRHEDGFGEEQRAVHVDHPLGQQAQDH